MKHTSSAIHKRIEKLQELNILLFVTFQETFYTFLMSTIVGINLIILLSNIIDFVSSANSTGNVSLRQTVCAIVTSVLCPMLVSTSKCQPITIIYGTFLFSWKRLNIVVNISKKVSIT